MPLELSRQAQRAMVIAEDFARRHGEIERFPDTPRVLGYMTADHLMLGVTHPNIEADVWARLGLDAAEIHEALRQSLIAGVWPPPPTDGEPQGRPDPILVEPDRTARHAWEYAAAEARRLHAPQIGTEHLLLGALRATEAQGRDTETLGHLLLSSFGVTLTAVFAVLLDGTMPEGGEAVQMPT